MASSIQRFHDTVSDPDQDVADLMAQASVLARVLRQKRIVDWHRQEQRGYGPDDALPSYRQQLEGKLVAWMPGSGWVQAPISDDFVHKVARRDIRLDFRAVVEHLESSSKSGGERINFDEEEMRDIQRRINHDAKLALAMPTRAYAQVIESCRVVLQLWVADLLEAGISGDGMKFTPDEKRRAAELDERITMYCRQAVEAGSEAAIAAARRPSLLGRLLGG